MAETFSSPSSSSHDRNARLYLLALRQGHFIESRPDCGKWSGVITEIEEKVAKAQGDLEAIERVFAAYCRIYPQLADLLSSHDPPVQEDRSMPALPCEARLPEGASAGACRWLERYEAFSREASPEAYEHYHVFIGLWALSTIAARRVYLPFQLKRLYPNLMIGLYGKSSEYMKSTTIEVAKAVIKQAGLDYLQIDGKMTPAKLLSDMAGNYVPADFSAKSHAAQERIRLELAFAGQRGLLFDELGKFVQSMLRKNSTNAEFVSIFLELHNCPQTLRSGTIVRGIEIIEQPYLSLIGGMTPPNLKQNACSGADFWTDGFWGRFCFVAAPPPDPNAPIIDATFEIGALPIPSELISPLVLWHERLGIPDCEPVDIPDKKGEPTGKYQIMRSNLPETEARMSKLAHDAYKRYRLALKQLRRTFDHDDFSASYARLPETALRMALLMASLENNNYVELRHWARAQELAELLRQSLHELYAQVNEPMLVESEQAKIETMILRTLRRIGPLTLNKLRSSYMKQYSTKQLEEVLSQLMKYGKVKTFPGTHNATKYQLVEEPHEEEGEP